MVFNKVTQLLADHEGINAADIKMENSFEELGLDSLSIVELAMELEDEFGVPVEVNEDLKTVGDVVRLIEAGKE